MVLITDYAYSDYQRDYHIKRKPLSRCLGLH